MATNFYKVAYDRLKVLIAAEFARLADTDRISFEIGSDIETWNWSNLGYEDSIKITPTVPAQATRLLLTSGEIVEFGLHILYYKKINVNDNPLDNITAFSENLMAMLIDNKDEASGFWNSMELDLDYNIELPEKYRKQNIYGFDLELTLTVGKFP